MFLPWINVTVNKVEEILWYLTKYPRPQIPSGGPNIPSSQDEGKDEVQPPPQATHPPSPASRLYALVIGIDGYPHLKKKLRGAVADARAMVQFLKTSVGVDENRIECLYDEHATRDNIIEKIRFLASCKGIAPGDPILIFYAGHGGEADPPEGWPAATNKIQMLLPYDFVARTTNSEAGQGIPDITLSILLAQLAKAKGNNITVISDSCHSGSSTREDLEDPLVTTRGIDLPDEYAILSTLDKDLSNSTLDEDLPSKDASRGDGEIPPNFATLGLASHVLLAACGAAQSAREGGGRGFFTQALLKLLESNGTDKMTYEQLIERLDFIPGQDPQCEGIHMSRILFDSMVPTRGRVLLPVWEVEPGLYELEAGEAYGITAGAKFNIYAIKDPNSECLGVLIAETTTAFTTKLLPSTSSFTLPAEGGYALQTSVGEKQDLKVFIAKDDQLLEVYQRVKDEMDKNKLVGKRGILPVEMDESPDILLTMQGSGIVFEITDKFCVDRGLTIMHDPVECNADDIFPVIASAADFYYHLRRKSSDGRLTGLVGLECYELEETGKWSKGLEPLLKEKDENIMSQGVVNVVAGRCYGFKVTNESALPLYVALFHFNMRDLSITSYYQSNKADRGKVDPSVPACKRLTDGGPEVPGSLTIGYGDGGHPPRYYNVPDKQDIDVGCLKLFVATEPVNFSHIEQSSPFLADRGDAPPPSRPLSLWDSITVYTVQHRA